MTLEEFKTKLADAMALLGVPVAHMQAAADTPCPVLCWQELGIRHHWGDDAVIADTVVGQLDYFTEEEYDQRHRDVSKFLTDVDCTFCYEDTTFDHERGEWRYTWTFYLFGAGGYGTD